MELKLITKREFWRSLVCQPFFIHHSLQGATLEVANSDDEEQLHELFWDDLLVMDATTPSYGQRIARTFQVINDYLAELLSKTGSVYQTHGTTDERATQTLAMLDSGKIILNPVFRVDQAQAMPFAFDTANATIINVKYSMKTKRADFAMGYYDFALITKICPVKNYLLFLPANTKTRKGDISLHAVSEGWVTTTGNLPGANKEGTQSLMSFIEAFRKGHLTQLRFSKTHNAWRTTWYQELPNIDDAITRIKQAMNAKLTPALDDDITEWGVNPEWHELLVATSNPLAEYSGSLVKKKEIVTLMPLLTDGNSAQNGVRELLTTSPVGRALISRQSRVVVRRPIPSFVRITAATKVVWYDFEGFSLPLAPMDYVLPYQQIVFQVSVIETTRNKESGLQNLVFDPRNIVLDDFLAIIRAIYRPDADCYVVYNSTYELTRLAEMGALLALANHPQYHDFEHMRHEIKHKTVDLYDEFKIASRNKMPAILLVDQYGKASIKNVERHISMNRITLPRPIASYKELAIGNGVMAMGAAVDRALGITGDKAWVAKTTALKNYCENDVRAMIMVYDYIALLMQGETNHD